MGGVAFTMCVGDQSTRQSIVANAGHSPVSSMALKHDQPPRTSFTRHGGIAVPLRTPYRGLLATVQFGTDRHSVRLVGRPEARTRSRADEGFQHQAIHPAAVCGAAVTHPRHHDVTLLAQLHQGRLALLQAPDAALIGDLVPAVEFLDGHPKLLGLITFGENFFHWCCHFFSLSFVWLYCKLIVQLKQSQHLF
jgi:hypothetical protein